MVDQRATPCENIIRIFWITSAVHGLRGTQISYSGLVEGKICNWLNIEMHNSNTELISLRMKSLLWICKNTLLKILNNISFYCNLRFVGRACKTVLLVMAKNIPPKRPTLSRPTHNQTQTAGRTDRWTIIPTGVNKLKVKLSGYISMPKGRLFLLEICPQYPKPKLTDSWTSGRTHEKTTLPIGIDAVRWQVILIHQYAIIYAIYFKWFVNNCRETCKCGKQTDGGTMIPINMDKLWVSYLDTSAWQNVEFFLQEMSQQPKNPSSWTAERTDERMKWQQYPSASMSAEGMLSGYISMPNFIPLFQSDLSANA